MAMTTPFLLILSLACAAPGRAAVQSLSEYLGAGMVQAGLSEEERSAVLRGVREKYGDYALEALSGARLDAAAAVLSASTFSCRGVAPQRRADYTLPAYKAVSRGAGAALTQALCRHACSQGAPPALLAAAVEGLPQMKSGGVPDEISGELAFLSIDKGWAPRTVNELKWGLVSGVQKGFDPFKFAAFVFVNALRDPSAPGRVMSDAQALFSKSSAPDVPAYAFRLAQAPAPKPEAPAPAAAPQEAKAPEPKPEAPGAKASEPKPEARPSEPAALFEETFGSDYAATWEPIQAAGGNFEKFGKVADNALRVSVPERNSWGKTGLVSKTPLLTVQDSTEAAALNVDFAFDENETTGFVIALSQNKNPDVWWEANVWIHWARQSVIAGSFNLVNTRSDRESYAPVSTPGKAPAKVTLSIKPGWARVATSQGGSQEGRFEWLKPRTSAYLYVFSHPPREGAPAALTLKSVKVYYSK